MGVMISYADGRFVDTSEVSLPFLDDTLGTLRGYRFFTTCRTANYKIFRLEDHIDRLFEMADRIKMMLPHTKQDLARILMEVLLRNRHFRKELFLIVFYTGGPADSSGMLGKGPARCYAVVSELVPPPVELYKDGVGLATYPFQRHFPTVKLFDYMGAVMAQHEVVIPHQAYGPLFVSLDAVPVWLEGSTYSVFGVKDGVVVTPPLDGRILAGITRGIVLELAKNLGITCEERPILVSEAAEFSESFLTSSVRGILPVVTIDSVSVGSGQVGPVCTQLMSAFDQLLSEN